MSDTFDRLVRRAAEQSRNIAEKLRRKKGDTMDKDDMTIEAYDGQDAFYSGTDEEYEEFLKNADVKMEVEEEAEPVENTRKINLNETINIQSVIDKFKKTAGGIESGAKSFKDTVLGKVDEFKAKKEEQDTAAPEAEHDDEAVEERKEFVRDAGTAVNFDKTDGAVESINSASGLKEKLDAADAKLQGVSGDVELLSKKLDTVAEKLKVIEIQLNEHTKNSDRNIDFEKNSLDEITSGVAEIKQAVNSVSKLSDSVFDLKNTQLNTKNVVADLETAFARLKKKCVMGVTILSILSAVVIVLEIILMLS